MHRNELLDDLRSTVNKSQRNEGRKETIKRTTPFEDVDLRLFPMVPTRDVDLQLTRRCRFTTFFPS